MAKEVTAGATGATVVAPKFSDTLTLFQPVVHQKFPHIPERYWGFLQEHPCMNTRYQKNLNPYQTNNKLNIRSMQYVLKVNIQNQNLKPLSAFCVTFSLVLSRLLTQTQFSCDVALGKPLFGSRPG